MTCCNDRLLPQIEQDQCLSVILYPETMNVFDEKKADLERHEFMMGLERGRLAVALDLLTDSLILVGQHGVYCTSSRNPNKPALDLQAVLSGMEGAKTLIQSVMEELRKAREQESGNKE
jgi:hypothetical protein